MRRNITVNYGLRFETQNEIHDHADFAPRVGIAWGLGGKGSNPKTVLRAGSGMFYDRFMQQYLLQAQRLNGLTQSQTIITSPDCYPDPTGCSGGIPASTIYQVNPKLRAPYTIQSAASVERQTQPRYLGFRHLPEFNRQSRIPLAQHQCAVPGCDPANPANCVAPIRRWGISTSTNRKASSGRTR